MAQEFTIKSPQIEDKINQLLPSQGGFQAGVDFSASTMVIPVVDLTETAEGSSLRQDLQTALSLNTVTTNSFKNTTVTLVNTTGYYRVFGGFQIVGGQNINISLTDGTTTKKVYEQIGSSSLTNQNQFDFNVFIPAGVSLTGFTSGTNSDLFVVTRQIADINGNLINP